MYVLDKANDVELYFVRSWPETPIEPTRCDIYFGVGKAVKSRQQLG